MNNKQIVKELALWGDFISAETVQQFREKSGTELARIRDNPLSYRAHRGAAQLLLNNR